jgi:hypothetical protein
MRENNVHKKDGHLQAQNMWLKFCNSILNNNRFFPCNEINKEIDEICSLYADNINKGIIFYRARIMTVEQFINTIKKPLPPFYGLNKKESHMPSKNLAKEGRANANGISYLYIACEEETALIEVRPIIDNHVSIAQIELQDDLKCIDLTSEYRYGSTSLTESLKRYVSYWFSMPVQHYEKEDYIPTQYIASYIESKGFDAIKYESSLNPGGSNIVIFNGNKAIPISSRILKIKSLGIKSFSIIPTGKDLVIEPK